MFIRRLVTFNKEQFFQKTFKKNYLKNELRSILDDASLQSLQQTTYPRRRPTN